MNTIINISNNYTKYSKFYNRYITINKLCISSIRYNIAKNVYKYSTYFNFYLHIINVITL